MKNNAILDIVIPTAGRFDLLEKCIDSIYENATIPLTITIVDDATDKKERNHYNHLFVYNPEKDVYKNVVLYISKRNEIGQGFGKPCNAGARLGKSKYIIFVSDDIQLLPNFLSETINAMETDPTIGICGAKLIFPPESTSTSRPAGRVQHVGVCLDVRSRTQHPLIGWSADNPKTCISRDCWAVTGALFTIRREMFNKTGGFDPIYGKGYWEDMDLCLKVRQLGGRIWLQSSAVAIHYTNATSEKNPQIFGNSFQINAMTFLSRWGNTGLLVEDDWSYG